VSRVRIGHVMRFLLAEAARRGTLVLADLRYNRRFEARNRWRSARLLAAHGLVRLGYAFRPGWTRRLVTLAVTDSGRGAVR